MPYLNIYVSDEDMATLRTVAMERQCPSADLAEAAVSEACLSVRHERKRGGGQRSLDLAGIDRPLRLVGSDYAAGDGDPPPMPIRRCEGAGVERDGSCIACDAVQGQACRKDDRRPRDRG